MRSMSGCSAQSCLTIAPHTPVQRPARPCRDSAIETSFSLLAGLLTRASTHVQRCRVVRQQMARTDARLHALGCQGRGTGRRAGREARATTRWAGGERRFQVRHSWSFRQIHTSRSPSGFNKWSQRLHLSVLEIEFACTRLCVTRYTYSHVPARSQMDNYCQTTSPFGHSSPTWRCQNPTLINLPNCVVSVKFEFTMHSDHTVHGRTHLFANILQQSNPPKAVLMVEVFDASPYSCCVLGNNSENLADPTKGV